MTLDVSIKAVRDAINIPEVGELSDDAIQPGIDRARPKVATRLGGGEPDELVWAAQVSTAAYLVALTYATRAHNVHPGAYNPTSGRWEPVAGAEGRDWSQVLNHLKGLMDDYLDELTPKDEAPKHVRFLACGHWGRG